MKLILVRHGKAAEASSGGDERRPLTVEGRAQVARVAAAIKRVVPVVDTLCSSPLVRASETAKAFAEHYGVKSVEQFDELTPEANPSAFVRLLEQRDEDETLLAVGHQPHLGELIALLLCGKREEFFQPKKTSVTCLEVWQKKHLQGELLWTLTADVVEKIETR